jgi:hypothetical protein
MISKTITQSQSASRPTACDVAPAKTRRPTDFMSSFTSAGALALAVNYFSTPSQGS